MNDCWILRCLLFFLLCVGVKAQQGGAPAGTTIVVSDPTGTVVPGADVYIVNPLATEGSVAKTDAKGTVSWALPPGRYDVVVRSPGFAAAVLGLEVGVAKSEPVPVTLKLGGCSPCVAVQTGPEMGPDVDQYLGNKIADIKAVDNHSHPVLPPPNDKSDRGFDALPVDNMEPETDPVAWRGENAPVRAAQEALWDVPATNRPERELLLRAGRAIAKAHEGEHYAEWVLDQAGIEVALANRVAMGAGIAEPRFRWVPYADALLFPLNNTSMETTPDRKQFYPLEEKLRARYLEDAGLKAIPLTLDEYLKKVVTATLEKQKSGGAVAEKFEVAYLRGFDFGDPSKAEAARVYARYAKSGVPSAAEYKTLQDFLFRYIAAECGRLGMAVHLHTMSGGGGYFNIAGNNPLLLEPVFDDARLRKTKFVMLHGGWPFVREAGSLLQKPNVYLDLSQEGLTFPPRTMAVWLREWLETYPDKVMFGTDGYPFSDALGWEESMWLASRNERQALGMALTGMLHDGEISESDAGKIAAQVLRETAMGLYSAK